MKCRLSVAGIAVAISVLLFPAAASAQTTEVLSNESIVQMVTGKVPKALILTKIQTTSTAFDLTPKGLVALHTSKIPDDVVKQMMKVTTANGSREPLTNADIVLMVSGQVAKDIILAKIQSTPGNYDMTTTGLVSLNQNKVSQDIMKAMMTPIPAAPAGGSQPPPPTSPPANVTSATPAASTPAAPAGPANPRKLNDGEAATIATTLTAVQATAKVKAYLTSKHLVFTVDKATGAIVSDWYADRACPPSPNHCMNRSNTRILTEGGKVVIRVQVFERKREPGAASKPWTESTTSRGKETGELADALEAYLAK